MSVPSDLSAPIDSLSENVRHLSFQSTVVILAVVVSTLAAARVEAQILASRDDAYVTRDAVTKEWSVGSAGLELVVGFNSQGVLSLKRLWAPETRRVWPVRAESEAPLTLDDQEVPLQEQGNRTQFLRAIAEETDVGVRLNLTFEHRASRTLITRTYAAYPATPTIETWTYVEAPSADAPIRVSNMIGWHLTADNAPVKWLTGLRAWMAPDSPNASFSVEGGELEDGTRLEIGSARRSSEAYVPLLMVEGSNQALFGGVIWSGAWRIAVDRSGSTLSIQADFPAATASASPDRSVELPHSFFGLADPLPGMPTLALRRFVMTAIRKGRPLLPLVTYNTWFPYGSRIDESKVAEEIVRAAGIGVELFVLDAGWYEQAGTEHTYDFTSGLGTWRVDRNRFRNGLSGLAELAREHGMKFGLWVEPERVALSTLDQPGLARQDWLATQDGSYGDIQGAQLCLASDAARQWVYERLIELLDEVRPDYLKWDNNFWVNCNRAGHDHGDDDGNYAHVVSLYGLLGDLRRRYPHMLIENVSGGGNRLDYAMLAFSDVGWMDDRTAPSSHVRHNFEGLALAFPPAYLLSFVIGSGEEPLRGGSDFPYLARSRMPGVFGLTYNHQELDADLSANLRLAIARYKDVRDIVAQSYAILVTAQAPVSGGWDVVEEVTEDQRAAIIFGFQDSGATSPAVIRPLNLTPGAIYDVRSFDTGYLDTVSGERLMRDGIELGHGAESRAVVFVLTQVF